MTVDTRTPTDIRRDAANHRVVLALQRGLAERGRYTGALDGWAGAGTVAALEAELGWPLLRRGDGAAEPPGLAGFRGSLARVHAWEGHRGHPYWPGGSSGVTLDPGFDLGHQSAEELRRRYAFLGGAALAILATVVGFRGAAARRALAADDRLRRISISTEQAVEVMPEIAARYWRAIVRRFPRLADPTTPPGVQTAMLSIAYNRGADNAELAPLGRPLAAGAWGEVADLVGVMQQDHQLAGVRRRRREEAAVIRQGAQTA